MKKQTKGLFLKKDAVSNLSKLKGGATNQNDSWSCCGWSCSCYTATDDPACTWHDK